MSNILVVDDEKEIADLIEIYLKNEGFTVYKYYSSKNILDKIAEKHIDLAILDVMMPELDGFSLCDKIRENYNFPIIFTSAKVEDIDKITGLSRGADDYVTKPFQPLELIARVKAQLRRYKTYNSTLEKQDDIIHIKGLLINNQTHECMLNEKMLDLTPIEFSILLYLCQNKGRVVRTEDLFQKVWKEKYFEKDNNTIMVHIRHLREKMNDTRKRSNYIETIWGVGYKINE